MSIHVQCHVVCVCVCECVCACACVCVCVLTCVLLFFGTHTFISYLSILDHLKFSLKFAYFNIVLEERM